MYKCANWNFTTRECMNPGENWGIPIPGVKTEKEGNGTTGWENLIIDLPETGQIYNFTLYPGDPGYIEDGANYCTYSPCIATSAMIRSVDNAGGIAEFDQPNTIDTCADGTSGTYLTDESVENITLTSLNHSQFITGDTVNFKTTVHCYDDGSMDNITFVYSNSTETAPSSWKIINKITPCPGSGIQEVSTNFTIDNRTGNHSVRVIIRYNASADVTCGTGNYDDNDDLSFEVYEIIQTTPTSNSPADLDVDIGEDAVIEWTLQDDEGAGDYYVTRNGQLFAGPEQWVNNTKLIIRPNNYFLGSWNYTIYYNNSQGNDGISDTVFVNVTDKTFPSCENVAGSSNANIPALTNITIDGNMEDWEAVLLNSRNYMQDLTELSGDLDTGMTADRDLTGFAYTWDSQYLYLYYKRLESGANVINMLAYLDYYNDGFMNSTDNIMRFVWSGSNQKYNSDLYNYVPSGTADELAGSGYDMPGSITINTSLEDNIIGGEESGIE
ncbi:MAG: hypothetical protein KAS15_03335, partial [Nanoarchaeota archaeon]|nr:hypothetical protein [Nanoarchaeota archaeon]